MEEGKAMAEAELKQQLEAAKSEATVAQAQALETATALKDLMDVRRLTVQLHQDMAVSVRTLEASVRKAENERAEVPCH